MRNETQETKQIVINALDPIWGNVVCILQPVTWPKRIITDEGQYYHFVNLPKEEKE